MKASYFIKYIYVLLSIQIVSSAYTNYNQYGNRGQQNGRQMGQFGGPAGGGPTIRPVFPEDYTPPIGFIGGPDYHPNIKLMFHLFLRYTFYSEYKQASSGTYYYPPAPTTFRKEYNGSFVLNKIMCSPFCPTTSYCDMGICRCKPGLMVSKGLCWDHKGGVIVDDEALNLREQNKEIIHRKCGRHSYCQRFDINLLCFKPPMGGRFGTCECRPYTQWNNQTDELSGASHSSCQVYVPDSCPTIINGTITEYDEEETEETEKILDEISTEPVENQFQQYRNGRIVKNSMYNQQQNYNSGNLYGQRNNIPGKQNLERMKPLSEEEKEEEIEKPNWLERINPLTMNMTVIKVAFCHDMHIRYKNYTEGLHREYWFAPFKPTVWIMIFFIIFIVIITGVCFYGFTHPDKSHDFFKNLFRSSKRPPTPDFDPDDVVDSDDEKPAASAPRNSGPKRNPNLFSTPGHNPNNPFNQTNGTPRGQRR